jgi:hypothetical protein
METSSKPERTKQYKAGIKIGVARTGKHIRRNYDGRVGGTAPIFLAAVGQYLVQEILDGMYTARKKELGEKHTGRMILRAENFHTALEEDTDLKKLVKGAMFNDNIVQPLTMTELKYLYHENEKKKKKKKKVSEDGEKKPAKRSLDESKKTDKKKKKKSAKKPKKKKSKSE